MDRVERKRSHQHYANQAELLDRDRAALESAMGRSDDGGLSDRGTLAEEEVRSVNVAARPRSDVTGAHEPGTGDETADGFDETQEAVRRSAEDMPVGGGRDERTAELPVFERPLAEPKT